ncbi:hypothetical protein GQ53DRAFT_824435 [Thozetella sp. PMI_491]|nr:hypothetical protein GQ53DRAFT_824435 [Thozetella sp. PMI_491]
MGTESNSDGLASDIAEPPTDDLGFTLNCAVWALAGASVLFLGLRIYAKLWRGRRLWWDDYILIAGWLALAISCAFQTVCVSFGLGKHGRFIKPENLPSLLLFSYLAGFFSILAAVWTKSSFAITLLSISEGWTRKIVLFILVSVNIVLGLNAALQWVQCWPVSKLWLSGPGVCWLGFARVRAYNTFVAAYSGAADIVLALLPWKIIWTAKIRRNEKLGALFAMSMGVFAGITSFLKIASLVAIGNSDLITMVTLFIFATAEGAVTIIAASIPILRALLHRQTLTSTPDMKRAPWNAWYGSDAHWTLAGTR